MRTVKWNSFLPCLLAALGVMTASARADVTTEKGASIVIFPKVVVVDQFDTVIQITNISNDLVFARCFYVNAQLTNPEFPEHPILNPPLWLEVDFNIRLTRQQPTQWLVSEGRPVNPFDMVPSGFGIDPGSVPPVVDNFVGELKCVEVDASGTPIGGNHLKGEATIISTDGDVSKYSAIGILGTDLAGATGNDLQLNNPTGEQIGQYDACPAELILNHFAEGEEDESSQAPRRPEIIPGDAVNTYLTFVPCAQDFENQRPTTVTLQFRIYNEFEVPFSTSTSVTCWKNIRLEDIGNSNVFTAAVLGSDVAQTFITPADETDGAVVAVAEEFHREDDLIARAAFNVHSRGDRFYGPDGSQFDHIVLPDAD
jgi:hypothetical protein